MTVDIYSETPGDSLSLEELEFYHLVNDYRESLGLDPIQLSDSLTVVAGRHAQDVLYNIWGEGVTLPSDTSINSWSDSYYYNDHSNSSAMHDAPQRLGTAYDDGIDISEQRTDRGYELSVAGPASVQEAFDAFVSSEPHNNVLINAGLWEAFDFNAFGIGVEQDSSISTNGGSIYHLWFGVMEDPAGARKLSVTRRQTPCAVRCSTMFSMVWRGMTPSPAMRGMT